MVILVQNINPFNFPRELVPKDIIIEAKRAPLLKNNFFEEKTGRMRLIKRCICPVCLRKFVQKDKKNKIRFNVVCSRPCQKFYIKMHTNHKSYTINGNHDTTFEEYIQLKLKHNGSSKISRVEGRFNITTRKNRERVLEVLMESESPMDIEDLCDDIPLHETTIRKYLKILMNDGLINKNAFGYYAYIGEMCLIGQ